MIPSKDQSNIYELFKTTNSNISISAVAGSGKTTTLIELLNFVPNGSSCLFLAFNKAIVEELKRRVKNDSVEIMTIHSYGWRMLLNRYGNKVRMNANKSISKTELALKKFEISEKRKGYYFYIIPKLIDLMRCNLTNPFIYDLLELCDHYDLSIDEREAEIAINALNYSNKDKSQFDFMDMVYQPAVDKSLRFRKYDYVFCDESQDFSSAQHKVILNTLNRRGRLITVGDPRQSIYGFAGADSESYYKLSKLNGESVEMPLGICYRCGVNIIKEAQKIVPEISYNPNSEEGIVRNGSLFDIEQGDWILCRNLKPLVVIYLWLMKNKIKSKIRGKDIGEGIISLINKTGAKTINGVQKMLEIEQDKLYKKLKDRGVRKPSLHPKMELLVQRVEVIEFLCEEVSTVTELIKMIEGIFSDEVKGILLSTIHKSKGLENDRIFFLLPTLIPSVYATQDWMLEQEMNLKYIAITRARKELIYIDDLDYKESIKKKIVIK